MTKRQLYYAAAIVLVATLIIQAQPLILQRTSLVHATNRSIALTGVLQGWNSTNPIIPVTQGDAVTMTVSSGDVTHRFVIDVDRNGFLFNPSCPPDMCSTDVNPPDTFSFNVDFAPGNYTYYCTFHPGSMHGTWEVKGFTLSSNPSSSRILRGSFNTSTISVTSINGFSGSVNLSATVSPSGPGVSIDPAVQISSGSPATATLTVSTTGATATGSYTVTITGVNDTSSNSLDVPVSVVAPDFSMSADSATLVIPLGSSQTSTITLVSLDQLSGSIDLSTGILPAGISVIFTPNAVPLLAGGTSTSTMNVTLAQSTFPGTYTIDVTGTNSSLQHTTTVTVLAGPDYSVSSSPGALNITRSQSGTSTITVTSFNSFSGNVGLSAVGSPAGLTLSISPSVVMVPSGGAGTAVLVVNASATVPTGAYNVNVTGTSGSMSHSAIVTVSVQDFSVTLSASSLSITQGSTKTVIVSLASVDGFAGNVSLATMSSSSSISLLLNTTTVAVSPWRPRFASLALSLGSLLAGNYTVTVTGTVGVLVHSASVIITVPPPVVDGASFWVGAVIAAGAIGAVVVIAVYLLRRGRSVKRGSQAG